MSSLMVANDLDIMMLEFAVEKLFLPKISVFDTVIMKKTTVMFRMLDYDWTAVNPHRTDYMPYKGSNKEELHFHGGKSIVFAIPTGSLDAKMKDVDIQIHVIKEISKYFEVNSSQEQQNVGVALANVDRLFNGIIKDLRERKELKEYLNCFHKRQPISRSLKETYEILDEDHQQTGATIEIYVRLSHFGKSVITEIERDCDMWPMFYAQEETNEKSPYQCRELKRSELERGCWGSKTFLASPKIDQLVCYCDKWGVVDHTDEKKKKKKKTGKGRRDRESGESEKRGSKSSGDHSQVSSVKEVKKRVGKADKKVSKAKTDNSKATRTSKTLEKNGTKLQSDHQKPRTTSKDKRAKGDLRDRKTISKLDKTATARVNSSIEGTQRKQDLMASNENAKMLEQLRKRRRGGIVTVGIVDKKKNICLEAIPLTRPSTCPREAIVTSTQLCTYFCPPCYCPVLCL